MPKALESPPVVAPLFEVPPGTVGERLMDAYIVQLLKERPVATLREETVREEHRRLAYAKEYAIKDIARLGAALSAAGLKIVEETNQT